MKKVKRYDGEEGSVVETETKQGKNVNIGDDVRERAMRYVAEQQSAEKETPAFSAFSAENFRKLSQET